MNPGDILEDFTLPNQDGKEISLSDFKSTPVVLFFYPRADTPGCTVEAERVYHKLEYSVAPAFADKAQWARIRRHCIAINGTFFNTHRMLGQYVSNAYYPPSSSIAASNQVVIDDEAHQPVLA